MRPMLRPGTHLLTRAGGRLQAGLDPRTAVVVDDTAAVRTAARLLSGCADISEYPDRALLDLLDAHGHLVDEQHVTGPGDTSRPRRDRAVEIRGFGHPDGDPARAHLHELLEQAGLRVRGPRSQEPRAIALVGVGEPSRDVVDEWTRTPTPYLVVRLTEGNALLGPFVVAGSTACLRCIDAHHTDTDPSWPLLIEQYAQACRRDRADGAPEPVDPLLAALAVAWAARDLATFLAGGRPATWSTTFRIDAGTGDIDARSWLRHPHCGCCWGPAS
ncbi:MAG: TOMM precursor leader peptide-binding protein [Nocardioidaceae bacterium]